MKRLSLAAFCLIVIPWSMVGLIQLALVFGPVSTPHDPADLEEIIAIDRALDVYKGRYGEYPPDFSTADVRAEIEQHMFKLFPDWRGEEDLPSDLSALGPHNALYFWLQGFGSDPHRRLTGEDRGFQPIYSFRIIQFKGHDEYYLRSGKTPLIYFRGDHYETANCAVPGCGTAYPYLTGESVSNRVVFKERSRFQLISGGVDGNYGASQVVAGSATFGPHVDNLTNFSNGPLGDSAVLRYRARLSGTRSLGVFISCICVVAYPFAILRVSEEDGIGDLRRLVQREASRRRPTARWRSILRDTRKRQKAAAVQRMSRRT